MDHFVVSARKYRPTRFQDVLGQQHVTTTLQNALKTHHLGHAFLFCGPRGVGKTTCARILAKALHCEQLTSDSEPCQVCTYCKHFKDKTTFNIYELDAASNNSVEDIRSLVDQVRYPPPQGRYKVYIIDEVHMLSSAAFNAFLKTLEEPPSYAIFILATTEKHKVLPTILSRCQVFDFQRIQTEDMVKQLEKVATEEGIPYEVAALHLISQKSDGALRDALSLFDVLVSYGAGAITYKNALDNLHILDYTYYFKLIETFLHNDLPASLCLYDEIMRLGFDGRSFLEGLVAHLRNLLVAQDAVTLNLLAVPPNIQQAYHEQALKTPTNFILLALQQANQFALQYKESLNKRFHIELLCITLHTQKPTTYADTLLQPAASEKTIESAKKKNTPKEVDHKKIEQKEKPADPTAQPHKPLTPTLPETTSAASPEKATSSLSKTLKIPQISLIKAAIEKEKIQTERPVTKENPNILDPAEIKIHWQAYLETLQADKKTPAYHLLHQPFKVDKNTIIIQYSNILESHIFDAIKDELHHFLKDRLHQAPLYIQANFSPAPPTSKKPYTAQEKFQYLAKKNPHLHALQTQLQLTVLD